MNGKTVDISLDLTSHNPSFSSNDLMLLDEPVAALKISGNNISFRIRLDTDVLFEGKSDDNKITGTVAIQGAPPNIKIQFTLTKRADTAPEKPFFVELHTIESRGVRLSAEIYVPKSAKPHPALVLVHSSSLNLKQQYSFYAAWFAKLGFEVLLFDKRGNGLSTGNYATATYNNLATDVIACLEMMKSRGSVDKNKIGLWGYSQGAMLLPMIVTKTSIPSFLIAKSPEVFSAAEGAAYADSLRLCSLGYPTENAHIAAESHRAVQKMIINGIGCFEVETFINQNAQKYSFMNQTGLPGNLTIDKNEFGGYYWKGRTENFYSYWQKLPIPALVLFGKDDELLNAVRNDSVIRSLNNKNITTVLFPKANHNLKKSFNPAKYPDFDWPRSIPECTLETKQWLTQEVLY